MVVGTVRETGTGYIIRTSAGEQSFAQDEVIHWTHTGGDGTLAAPAAAVIPPAAAVIPPAAPASGGAPGIASAKGRDKGAIDKTVARLLERGRAALEGGDYNAARDAFADALLLSPKNPLAAQGAGFAYLQIKNYSKARDTLEIAYAAVQPPPRALACNLAVSLGKTRNPMRAAKVLKEYLVAHPQPLDEPALNALAATLFQADESVRHNTFYEQVGSFYDEYNKRLEATRSGEKRWGTQWLGTAEADKKLNIYLEKRSKIEDLNRRIASDKAAFASSAQKAQDAIADSRLRQGAAASVPIYKREMAQAQSDFQLAQTELERESAGYEQPPIDESLAVVVPDIPVAAPTVVAVAPGPGSGSTGAAGTVKPVQVAVVPTRGNAGPKVTDNVIRAEKIDTTTPDRKVEIETNAVAFPVAPDLVVTSMDAVADATSITVQLPQGDPMSAQVVSRDQASGLALLQVSGKKFPYLALADAFKGGAVTCVGFPDVNLFDPIAAPIAGTVALKGDKSTLSLSRSPRIGGAPLLVNGKVVGVELGNHDSDRGSIGVATVDDLRKLLGDKLPARAVAAFDPVALAMQLTAVRERG